MIMHNAPMKRTLLSLLLLAPIVLAGCQTIKSHNPFRHKEPAYKTAQQEQPLEVPPGMDQPPTTDALAIPGAGSGSQTSTGAAAEAGTPPAAEAASAAGNATATTTTLTLPDTPDSVYHRVGLALARGDAGPVTSHDDAAHTYQVAVNTVVTTKPEGGFLHRMFHRSKSETVQGTVTVSVAPSGTGSVVSAQGNPDAAARVMTVLQQRLGGG
jgi:uncharacterized lipoprotein